MENRILNVYDTITRKLVDIEVPQDIYDEYNKLNWRIKKKNQSFYKHEIQFATLISNSNSSLEGFKEFVSDSEDTVDRAVDIVMTEKLNKCIHLLKPHEKKLIKMLFFDDLTENECGTYFNCSQVNIHKAKHRVLSKLYKLLNNHYEKGY